MNRHFFLSFRNNSILLSATSLFVLAVCLIQSCKKTNVDAAASIDAGYTARFFTKPANSSAETDAAINLLRNENDKNDFISRLPAEAGVPVWNRLIEQRSKKNTRVAERGTIADKKGNLLIPLSNDNRTLSALLFAMKREDKYEFYCYTNNYAYQVSFCDKYSIKQREKVMGLFMSMSNYVFGIHDFSGIPKDLFADLKGAMPDKDEKTKKMFLVKYKEAPADILISDEVVGPVSFCAYHFSGNCSCPGNPNDDEALCQDWWQPCSYNVCSEWSCKTFWVVEEDPGNPSSGGDTPPSNGTNTGSNPGPANASNPLPNLFSGGLPKAPCTNCAWYTENNFEPNPTGNPAKVSLQLNQILGPGDSYAFQEVNSNDALGFSTVDEFNNYLKNTEQNLAFSIETPTTIQPDQKLLKAHINLVFVAGIDIRPKIKRNSQSVWEVMDVTSNEWGASVGWSWEQKSYSASLESADIIVVDVIGIINYNIIVEGIGTIYKQEVHFQIRINQHTGQITSITKVN